VVETNKAANHIGRIGHSPAAPTLAFGCALG
jgi:hypothetical protein